jgi:L-threonylcarbamoyladenylate synthase
MTPDITNEAIRAFEVLKKGGTILYPTDTIWGIGCDAKNQKAVNKIYQIKQRPESKSLIILLNNKESLEKYMEKVPLIAFDLIEQIEKPLTIIYPKAKNLPSNLCTKDGCIAIRITKNEFCSKLIQLLDSPLVSTSANTSGELPPLIFKQVSNYIKSKVDYTVNLSQNEIKEMKASTIIRFINDFEFEVVRE